MKRKALCFSMTCPFYHYDERTEEETECQTVIQVAVYDRDDWEAWGCPHLDGTADGAKADPDTEDRVVREIERREQDAYEEEMDRRGR